MIKFIIRWGINAVALWAAIAILPGIEFTGNWTGIVFLALIFGFVNALLRPLLKFLTCPLIILTLGFFTLAINTFLFWLAGVVGANFGVGFTVDGLWPAFLGGLVVSFVSIVLTMVFKDDRKRK